MSASRRIATGLALATCAQLLITLASAEEPKSPQASSNASLPPEKLAKLAALYLKLGQTDDCGAALTSLLNAEPRNRAGLRILARLEFRLGRFAESVQAATSALSVSADDADAMTINAAALTAMGRTAEAAKAAASLTVAEIARREEILGLTPGRESATPDGSPPAADPASSNSDIDTDKADAAFDAAREAIEKKRLKDADKLTADALNRWPHNQDAIELRADFLSEAGRPMEAIPLYRKLKAAHDASSGPFPQQIDLAFALNDAGMTDEARAAFNAVLTDPQFSKKDRMSAAKVLAEQREFALLAQGTEALDRGDKDEASRICDQLLQEQFDSDDVRDFHADVLHAKGMHAEAAAIYTSLKKTTPRGKRFDSQIDYASALAATLNYRAASAAYEEITASPTLYTSEERADAQEQLQEMHHKDFPRLSSDFIVGTYDEGNVWRLRSQFDSMRSGRTRYVASADWDAIKLTEDQFPTEKVEHRINSVIGIGQELDSNWNASLLIGGYDDGIMASVAADYAEVHGLASTLRLAFNDPSRDSLLLEAMDGRQHSISADISSPLGKHFAFDSTLLGRLIEIDGDSIGSSIGIEAQFRWHPFTVSEDTWLAYAIEEKSFSADSHAFDRQVRSFFGTSESARMPEVYDAIPKRINRHALQAHSSVPLTKNFVAALTGEIARRLEVNKTEYAVIGELKWKLTPRSDIHARLEYDTGGAGPNTNGSVTVGTLGFKWSW